MSTHGKRSQSTASLYQAFALAPALPTCAGDKLKMSMLRTA